MNKKEEVEELLRDYPFMVSNVITEIKPPVADNLKSIDQDLIPALENWNIDYSEVDNKILGNIEKVQIIEGVINLVLNSKETEFVKEYFWQNKTLSQLADGRDPYNLYSKRSMERFKSLVLDKLKKGNILKDVV